MHVTGLAYVCDMTHSCVWHDKCICVTWLIHMFDMTHSCEQQTSNGDWSMCGRSYVGAHLYVWLDSFVSLTRLISMCDTISLIAMCDVTGPCGPCYVCTRETWIIRIWDTSFTFETWLILCETWLILCETWLILCETWLILCETRLSCTCDVTHLYVWHDLFVCVTEDLGCIKKTTCDLHVHQRQVPPAAKHCNTLHHSATRCTHSTDYMYLRDRCPLL